MQNGLQKFGPKIGQGLAQAGFGDALLSAAVNLPADKLSSFLSVWQQDLRIELGQNKSGKLSQKFHSLVDLIPDDFPDLEHLQYYTMPITSFAEGTAGPDLLPLKPRPPDIAQLAMICNQH